MTGIAYAADGPEVVAVAEGSVCRITLRLTLAEARAVYAALGAAVAVAEREIVAGEAQCQTTA